MNTTLPEHPVMRFRVRPGHVLEYVVREDTTGAPLEHEDKTADLPETEPCEDTRPDYLPPHIRRHLEELAREAGRCALLIG